MNRPSLHALSLWGVALFSLLFFSCDDSDSLLDAEKLRKKLELTPVQSEIVSSHVRLAVEEVNRYLEVIRQREQELNRRGDIRVNDQMILQDPDVENARLEAVRRIRQIASTIREELTPEQQGKFDQIPLPQLTESPRELSFMVMEVSGGRFAGMQSKTSTKINPMVFSSNTSDTTRYNVLKEQRTIILGPPPGQGPVRFSGGGGPGLRRFPVVVTATLIDSAFIEAEHRYTAPPDSLAGAAGQARLQTFFTQQQVSDILTIRLVLSTTLHESYIDMDRWVAYIEDQDGRPYEPTEIVEIRTLVSDRPEQSMNMMAGRQSGARGGFRGRPGGDNLFIRKARRYDLRFPSIDVYGNYLLRPGTESLELVFFDKNDPQYRTQGKWELK
jgi:hypothetical protein